MVSSGKRTDSLSPNMQTPLNCGKVLSTPSLYIHGLKTNITKSTISDSGVKLPTCNHSISPKTDTSTRYCSSVSPFSTRSYPLTTNVGQYSTLDRSETDSCYRYKGIYTPNNSMVMASRGTPTSSSRIISERTLGGLGRMLSDVYVDNAQTNNTPGRIFRGVSIPGQSRIISDTYVDVAQTINSPDRRVSERIIPGQSRIMSETYMDVAQTINSPDRRVSERIIPGQSRIMSDTYVDVANDVTKKVWVEDIVERTIVVPEKRIREVIQEERDIVRKRVIHISKPSIVEKIIEVPEYVYKEKIVEVPQVVVNETTRQVPVVKYQERIIEVPKIIEQHKIVEVPEIRYEDVPVERLEEIIEIHEKTVLKEVPVSTYVDKLYAENVNVEDHIYITRNFPIPVQCVSTYEFKLPKIRPSWTKVNVPLYVPRFIELPVPMELNNGPLMKEAQKYAEQISLLGMTTPISYSELENLSKVQHVNFPEEIRNQDYKTLLSIVGKQLPVTALADVQQKFQADVFRNVAANRCWHAPTDKKKTHRKTAK